MHWYGGHFSLGVTMCIMLFVLDLLIGILRSTRMRGKSFGWWFMSLLLIVVVGLALMATTT